MQSRIRLAAQKVTALTVATVAAEMAWAAFRPLPRAPGLDASGVLMPEAAGPPLRVVVLGDSTLTGPGLERADDIWVRKALAQLDMGRPVELTSFAVGGSRVGDVRRRVDDAGVLCGDVAIVSVGSNDAIHGTPTGQFARDYERLLSALLATFDVVAVTNVGDLGNIARFAPPLHGLMRLRGRRIGRCIDRAAARHDRAVLLDVTPANRHFRDRSLFGPDLFHPTSVGHHLWATTLTPGLHAALARAR